MKPRGLSLAACGFALALLQGCILQTDVPLISDSDARLLFGTGAVTLALFQHDPNHPGQWAPYQPASLTVQAEGNHYTVPDPDDPADPAKVFNPWLLPLDATHAAVEVTDPSGLLYGIAIRDGKTIDFAMLDCRTLKAQPAAAAWVTFEDGDCHPKRNRTDATALFTALLPLMPEPGLRLVAGP